MIFYANIEKNVKEQANFREHIFLWYENLIRICWESGKNLYST